MEGDVSGSLILTDWTSNPFHELPPGSNGKFRRPVTVHDPADFTLTIELRIFHCSKHSVSLTMPGSSPLVAFIREHIRRHGPVPFPWFMEQALYHPEFGYYTSTRRRIGREGDLLHQRQRQPLSTASCWPLSSSKCGSFLECPRHFTIVEEGAEDGQLALDILSAIREESIEAAECIRYTIVEPISGKQLQQRARLEPAISRKVTMADQVSRPGGRHRRVYLK